MHEEMIANLRCSVQISNYIIYASLYKHNARTLHILRAGFVLNLYGSESNSDNPRSRSRNYVEYNVAQLGVQFRIIDHSRAHR